MALQRSVSTSVTGMLLIAACVTVLAFAGIASALTATCTGAPTATNITWAASAADGVAPFAFLWGNGSTSTSQTVAVSPGTYSMTLQATDASSTVATSTCSATVVEAAPAITSFTATPSAITAGQSSLLSWAVANASSTSINNGIGAVTGTSVTVAPSVTTTYTLSAVNPGGTTTASATVTVSATTTPPTGIAAQIQALLAQIRALQAQLVALIAQNVGNGSSGGSTATSTPTTCFGFSRDLKYGDRGDDVRELQKVLAKEDPSLFPPGLATGFFGPKTEAALKMLQRRFGVAASNGSFSGYFGPRSRAFFRSRCPNVDSDNDGTPDVRDVRPFDPNVSTSTNARSDDRGNNGKQDRNNGKGKGGSDGDGDSDDD